MDDNSTSPMRVYKEKRLRLLDLGVASWKESVLEKQHSTFGVQWQAKRDTPMGLRATYESKRRRRVAPPALLVCCLQIRLAKLKLPHSSRHVRL